MIFGGKWYCLSNQDHVISIGIGTGASQMQIRTRTRSRIHAALLVDSAMIHDLLEPRLWSSYH